MWQFTVVKGPVFFCHLTVQGNCLSLSYQHRPEGREEEHFKDGSQKLHKSLSLITHGPELDHVATPSHEDEKFSLYSRWL